MLGNLPPNCLTQYPTGRWGFVGSVDVRLGYVRKADGQTPTAKEVTEDHMLPGDPNIRRLRPLSWATRDEALAAAAAINAEVTL